MQGFFSNLGENLTIYRCILPSWAVQEFPNRKKVLEGQFTNDQLKQHNEMFYNIYYLPNYPSIYDPSGPVAGHHIDKFDYLFIDMDLKEGKYKSKDEFIEKLGTFKLIPTSIVDSGNGVHAYWRVSDLDPMNFLKLQRRLLRYFDTDEAVCKIYQLMRVPNTVNSKNKDDLKLCEEIFREDFQYTCEEVDSCLPPITESDLAYCTHHFNVTYKIEEASTNIDDKIPIKFADLIRNNQEAKEIWSGNLDDRSKGDYRLGHIMFASNFSKEEALSVLVNSAKALGRSTQHRHSYASNIVDKIWTYEETKETSSLSRTVRDILERSGDAIKGVRFPCHRYIDATHHGFRLGQVIGLVAGSGVGKTAVALNMFRWFAQNNPDYDHFFIPLEQPANEIADRWQSICGNEDRLYDKVHVISNYDDDGNFRHLSFDEIKNYILKFQQVHNRKVGCIVIDHIGALKKKGKNGENQDLMDICHQMKAFAIHTNTLLVMQSQAPRQKAGIGDLELDKDAAYGTVYFESYCDYLITIWQPLKRCYSEEGCPTVTAFKFCKIRHKKKDLDDIQEDVCYKLFFDSTSGHLRSLTQNEEKSFQFFNNKATNKRKEDRKTDIISYQSVSWDVDGKPDTNKDSKSA